MYILLIWTSMFVLFLKHMGILTCLLTMKINCKTGKYVYVITERISKTVRFLIWYYYYYKDTIGWQGFDSRQRPRIFLFITLSRPALVPTEPPIQWIPEALSLEVKRPGREADHSPQSKPRSKNALNYNSNPPIRLHGVLLVKHRDNFTFYNRTKDRDSPVGIALGYSLDDRGSTFWLPAGAGNFSLHHRIQNGSGAHPASYPMSIGGSFPEV
jgi:hypothetical protein